MFKKGEKKTHRDKHKIISYQTSSLGKIVQKYLRTFYSRFSDLTPPKDICENFRVIFPTEGYVEKSHLGLEMASSVILQPKFWHETADFPKESFHHQEGS